MIKNDNRGFAITTIFFGILIVFTFLLLSILGMLALSLHNKQQLIANDDGNSARNIAKIEPIRDYATFAMLKAAVQNDKSKAINGLYCFASENICRYVSQKELLEYEESVYFSKGYNSNTVNKSLQINYTGYYYVEACGAGGGNASKGKETYVIGGKGACYDGYIKLSAGDNLYFNIGTKGKSNNGSGIVTGGINGGGNAGDNGTKKPVGSGGGATDIRFGYDYYDTQNDEIEQKIENNKMDYLGPDVPLSAGTYQVDIYGENLNSCGYVSNGSYLGIVNDVDPTHMLLEIILNIDVDKFQLDAYQYYYNSSNAKCKITRETFSRISDRILVVGGGGGSSYNSANDYGTGGGGGSLVGLPGANTKSGVVGKGGTQTSGGNSGIRMYLGGGWNGTTGGGGGYFGGLVGSLYSGAGGGSSFISGYAGSNTTAANSIADPNSTISYTKKNIGNSYVKDQLLLSLGGITYYKKNQGQAFYGYYYDNNWHTFPILVGETPESVAYYRSYNGQTCTNTNSNTLSFNGKTYYYSVTTNCQLTYYASDYRYPNTLVALSARDARNAAKEILGSYTYSYNLHYSNKYFINSHITPNKNSGDGYVNISYVGETEPKRNGYLNNVRYVKNCINNYYELDKNKNRVYNNEIKEWAEFQIIKDGVNQVQMNANNIYTTVPTYNDLYEVTPSTMAQITNGIMDDYNDYWNFTYKSPNTKKKNLSHCIIYDLGSTINVDEIAVWHNYNQSGVYEYNRLLLSSNGIDWREINWDNKKESANGIRVNAWEDIEEPENSHYTKVTYDYNVNKKIIIGEYYDTDYNINWDYDFEIETTINVPTLGQNYMLFSSEGKSNQNLNVHIDTGNRICVSINQYNGYYCTDYYVVKSNEDIKVTFTWDSLHDRLTLKAKGNTTNAELSRNVYLNESISETLRFGNADHRTNPQNTYQYPINVKSFKISTMYLSGGALFNKPLNIVHHEKSGDTTANDMIANEEFLLGQAKSAPEEATTYVANWGEEVKLVNITYDYNINRKIMTKEYYDTDFKINWDTDFEIETIVNVPQLGQNYTIFSTYSNTTNFIMSHIDTNNNMWLIINNSWYYLGRLTKIDEDIIVKFKWDSLHMEFTYSGKGAGINNSIKSFQYLIANDGETLRIGTADYRKDPHYTFLYPIYVKSFKISAIYGSGLKFGNKPQNIIHHINNTDLKVSSMLTDNNNSLLDSNVKVPNTNTTYKATWNEDTKIVNITYDYNVNKKVITNEYYDTDFKVNWDTDFKVETVVNIPQLYQTYLLFSSYAGNGYYLVYYINTNNVICLDIYGEGSGGGSTCMWNTPVKIDKDIKATFEWDSFHKIIKLTATGDGINGNQTYQYYAIGNDSHTLRFGMADYRANPQNTFLYPINVKSFKISSTYRSNLSFGNKPQNIINHIDNTDIAVSSMTSGNSSLLGNINVPNNDTTYKATWSNAGKQVNITYDYNVNKKFISKEYYDTGYTINWDRDFEIDTTVNIPYLSNTYMLFSTWQNGTSSAVIAYINVYNQLSLNINGFEYNSGNDRVTANEDIAIKFKWDSSHKKFKLTAMSGNTIKAQVENTSPQYLTGNDGATIRFGMADYRPYPEYTFIRKETIKSFTITTKYTSGIKFNGKPVNISHIEDDETYQPSGLFTTDNINLDTVNTIPNEDKKYIVNWGIDYSTANITYDYDVSKKFNAKEYLDTGYRIDWNRDFEIETTINIPRLERLYMLFSTWQNGTSYATLAYIDYYGYLKIAMNNTEYGSSVQLPIKKDIKIKFKWDSLYEKFTLTATTADNSTNIKIEKVNNFAYVYKDGATLRIGMADYRPNPEYTFTESITIKNFKIMTTYLNGYKITQPTPTEGGYITRNWKKQDNSVLNDGEIINGNATYHTNWIANTFNVKLNGNGGTLPITAGFTNDAYNQSTTKTVTFGSPYGLLPTPIRAYWRFVGWYTSQYNGTLVDNNTSVTTAKDHELYAIWEWTG